MGNGVASSTIAIMSILNLLAFQPVPGSAGADTQPDLILLSHVDNSSPAIGEIFHYTVRISHSPGIEYDTPPDWGANLDEFEIKDFEIIGPEDTGGRIEEGRIFTLTTFLSGDYVIPPLAVRYLDSDGGTQEISTDQIFLHVRGVSDSESEMEDIREIRDVASFPKPLWPYITLIGILSTVAIGILSYRQIRRKRETLKMGDLVAPPRPPHEIVLEELARLRGMHLDGKEQMRRYYFQLSAVMRHFIELRYLIPALDETTEELLDETRRLQMTPEASDLLERFLRHSDLVKFARLIPPLETARMQVDIVEEFVEKTREREPLETDKSLLGLPGMSARNVIEKEGVGISGERGTVRSEKSGTEQEGDR